MPPSRCTLALTCALLLACTPPSDSLGHTVPGDSVADTTATSSGTTIDPTSDGPGSSATPTSSGTGGSTDGSTADASGASGSTGAAAGCELVVFADAALEAAVRDALAQPDGPIAGATLAQLTELTPFEAGIGDLQGLECATGLVKLSLYGSPVADLGPIAGLGGLQELIVYWTDVIDLAPLAGLSGLRVLNIGATDVVDIGPLAGLTALEELHAHAAKITDLTPLAAATALKRLDISETPITDLGPLSGATALEHLTMYGTAAPDLSPLTGAPIRWLYAKGCGISDITPLASFPTPREVDLDQNVITDLSALQGVAWDASKACGDVLLHDNPLSDTAPAIAQQVCETTKVMIWPFDLTCIGNTCVNP